MQSAMMNERMVLSPFYSWPRHCAIRRNFLLWIVRTSTIEATEHHRGLCLAGSATHPDAQPVTPSHTGRWPLDRLFRATHAPDQTKSNERHTERTACQGMASTAPDFSSALSASRLL